MSHQTEAMVRRASFISALLFALSLASGVAKGSSGIPRETRKLLVLAPIVANPDPQFNWLGVAIQQSLATDLTRQLPVQVDASASSANDAAEAAILAKNAGAQRVIISTIQVAGDQIRITGQIIDSANQRVLLALKATGRLDDLFEMEDQLSGQAARGLIPARPLSKQASPAAIAPSGALRLNYATADAQAGLQYARPYENNRFQAAEDRYFFGSSYGSNWCFGGWYGLGLGWGYSTYHPAAPGWAW